jgi:uncharacterized protein (DUF1810 family)
VHRVNAFQISWHDDGNCLGNFSMEVPVTNDREPDNTVDPYDLQRFIDAQASDYAKALAELRSGRKRSHWMWYIFPQAAGLGYSATAQRYALKSRAEAQAYLDHPVLGPRLITCAEALLQVEGRTALDILGSPDDLKLRSCATLFELIAPGDSEFSRLLVKYFHGERDAKTLRLMATAAEDREQS